MGFSRQEYWSGLPCPPPSYLPDPETEPTSPAPPALQAYSSPTEPPGKPILFARLCKCYFLWQKAMLRFGQLERKRGGSDKHSERVRVDAFLLLYCPGCGYCHHCCWRCCNSQQLGVKREMSYSSTCHRFANVQATLALFGAFGTSCVYLPWEKGLVSSLHERALSDSVQFIAQSCLTLQPHGQKHSRLPCPSPTPGACLLSQWCHPNISSSVIPLCSCLQSFPASGSFDMSQFFSSGGRSIGVSASASVLPMNIQDWFPLGWTGCISLQSKGLSRVFSNSTVQKHQFFSAQLSLWSNSHIHTWLLEKP